MTNEQNQQAVRRFFQAIATGDASAVNQVLDPKYTGHDLMLHDVHGFEGGQTIVHTYHDGLSDSQVTFDDIFSSDDKVVCRFTFTATQTGMYLGIPPTNKKATVTGIGIFRCSNGKILENWVNFDALGLLQQLGVVPAMQPRSS
jgi:predicted ester cyclase